MIKRYIIGLIIVASFIAPLTTRAFSYSGYKWSSNGTTVDSSDASWPWAWISPLASSMSTWNNTGSSFRFSVGSGHKFTLGSVPDPVNQLAVTFLTLNGSNIVNVHTVLNQSVSFSTTGEANKFDVQNVVTHELGHWLRLYDLYGSSNTQKTLYGIIYKGETLKRSLDSDDINGIKYVYP